MMNSKDIIIKVHDNFILEKENILSNEEIIELYNGNYTQIIDCLQNPNDEIFAFALRIKSVYCFSLSELNENELLKVELEKTLPYFDLIYDTFDRKMNNIFFEKLYFHHFRMHYLNSELDKAEKEIKCLIQFFPENNIYPTWLLAIQKKRNPLSSLINRFLKK